MTELTKSERFLLMSAVEFYLLNKQVDPIAGQVPYIEEMTDLFSTLRGTAVHFYKNANTGSLIS